MGYLTPDSTPADFICYRVRVPNETYWKMAFVGALWTLSEEYTWELFNTLTPTQCAEQWRLIYQDAVENVGECMLGSIVPVALATLPGNMLLCDGSQYLRTDYPNLYAVIHGAYIDDADHFHTPDLRSSFIYGATTLSETDNSGGAASQTLSVANLPSHTHLYNAPVPGVILIGAGAPTPVNTGSAPTATGAAGSGTSFAIIPPYVKLAYAIIAR